MTEDADINKDLTNFERLDEASLLLCRAISINDLLFELSNNQGAEIPDSTLSGVTDSINSILQNAKDLVDGMDRSKISNAT